MKNPQKSLSHVIHEAQFRKLQSLSSSNRDRARLLSVSAPQANDWVSALPIDALGLRVECRTFRIMVRRLLGIPLFDCHGESISPRVCQRCLTPSLDEYGDHSLVCRRGHDKFLRHNWIRDTLVTALRGAGILASVETPHLLDNPNLKPGDFTVPSSSPSANLDAFDVTIVDPLQISFLHDAAKTGGVAARSREASKMSKYQQLCAQAHINFTPLVWETFGGSTDITRGVLKQWTKLEANRTGEDRELVYTSLFQLVSVRLQVSNARMILRSIGTSTCPRVLGGEEDK